MHSSSVAAHKGATLAIDMHMGDKRTWKAAAGQSVSLQASHCAVHIHAFQQHPCIAVTYQDSSRVHHNRTYPLTDNPRCCCCCHFPNAALQMLISDTSGAVMTVPVTCTPPLATTSMDRPVTCTFKAEGVNARAMYPGTPMLLMQPLVGAGAAGAGEPMPTTTVGPVSSAATKPTELRALGNCTEYAVTWRGVQVAPAAANRTAPSSSSSSVQIVPVGTAPKGETCATADVRFAVKATPTGGRNACREATEVRLLRCPHQVAPALL